jgi:hypothetical protein
MSVPLSLSKWIRFVGAGQEEVLALSIATIRLTSFSQKKYPMSISAEREEGYPSISNSVLM